MGLFSGIFLGIGLFVSSIMGGIGGYFYHRDTIAPSDSPVATSEATSSAAAEVKMQPTEIQSVETKSPAPQAPVRTNTTTVDGQGSVYVTPKGTKVIQPPAGWSATVLTDNPPEAYVIFSNPEKTVALQVGVNIPMPESANPLAQTKRLIDLYTNHMEINGQVIEGEIVRNDQVILSGATGFDLEIKRQDLSGKFRLRSLVVARSGPDYYYSVAAKVPEDVWPSMRASIEASIKTLEVLL